jgi:hypothetical protein
LENQRPWPADKVERWQIDRLIPYAKKARTHTDAQAVLGISESEYVTRFTNVTYTDWVMRCTPRKVLRTAEQEPVVLPPAKAHRQHQGGQPNRDRHRHQPVRAPIMEAHQCCALAHWAASEAACSTSKSCW